MLATSCQWKSSFPSETNKCNELISECNKLISECNKLIRECKYCEWYAYFLSVICIFLLEWSRYIIKTLTWGKIQVDCPGLTICMWCDWQVSSWERRWRVSGYSGHLARGTCLGPYGRAAGDRRQRVLT